MIWSSADFGLQCERTLRVWISNTVEDQPWQSDTLDMDAFDFSTNMDSSYRVKIEGRLLDDEEDDGENSDSSDDEEEPLDPDAMDEDGKEKKKKSKLQGKQYKLSHFFKAMTVDFDRNKGKDGQEQSVEWKKPTLGPNAANLPNSADFDQLEFKRGGDENQNITINLFRDESPEKFALSPLLHEIMDTTEATRAEVVMGIWDYIRAKGLQGDDEKRSFECDERLKAVSDLYCFYLDRSLTNPDIPPRPRLHPIHPRQHRPVPLTPPPYQTPLHHPCRPSLPRRPPTHHLRHPRHHRRPPQDRPAILPHQPVLRLLPAQDLRNQRRHHAADPSHRRVEIQARVLRGAGEEPDGVLCEVDQLAEARFGDYWRRGAEGRWRGRE